MSKPVLPAKAQGVTLLELLLVLVVMAILIFAAFPRFQAYERTKDIAVIQQNVNLLFQASQTYYHLCCSASQGVKTNPQCSSCGNNQFCISTAALTQANLMPKLMNSSITKPDDYQVSTQYMGTTETTKKPIYQLLVHANLNINRDAIIWYLHFLQATTINGTTLIWQKLPNYNSPAISDNLWIFGTGLRQFKEGNTGANGDDSCAY